MCERSAPPATASMHALILGIIPADIVSDLVNLVAYSTVISVSSTHLRAHETVLDLVSHLLLVKKK